MHLMYVARMPWEALLETTAHDRKLLRESFIELKGILEKSEGS